MFLIKLVLKLLTLPVLLFLYIFRIIFTVIVGLGSIVTNILAVICLLGGILFFFEGNVGSGIGGLALAVFFFLAPYLVSGLLAVLIGIVEGLVEFITE